jgi:hypothetical protein
MIVGIVAAALAGCRPSSALSAYQSVTTGMTLTEVEQRLGPGEAIERDELPESFRTIYAERVDTTYRRWTSGDVNQSATLYAVFVDGKLTSERLVEDVRLESGTGSPP